MVKYQVKNQMFDTEKEAIKGWLALGDRKKYYSIFKHRDGIVTEYKVREIDLEKVDEYLKSFNSVEVRYKKSNKIYKYKDAKKIDLNNLDNIICLELRGINGNVIGGVRIEYVDDTFVAII